MQPDDFGTVYRYDSISGLALGRCAFLAYRTEPEIGLDPRRMESWVVLPSDNFTEDGERLIAVELGITGFLTGLFYTESDTVYASEMHGRLYVRRQDGGRPRWTVTDAGDKVELHGVWGLSDELIYVWGRDAWRPRLWVLNGGQLVAMPAPPARTTIIRGLRHDMLFAAGPHGFLARWDGSTWRRVRLSTLRNVTGLALVDDDTYWLTTDNGKLFEGSSHGWAVRAEHEGPLYDVASCAGGVWLAAGLMGLLKLQGTANKLAVVASSPSPIGLMGGTELLALSPQHLATLSPPSMVSGRLCRNALRELRAAMKPSWQS